MIIPKNVVRRPTVSKKSEKYENKFIHSLQSRPDLLHDSYLGFKSHLTVNSIIF